MEQKLSVCIIKDNTDEYYKCFTKQEAKQVLEENILPESELKQIKEWFLYKKEMGSDDWLEPNEEFSKPERDYPLIPDKPKDLLVKYYSLEETQNLLCKAFQEFINHIGNKPWYLISNIKYNIIAKKKEQKSSNWITRVVSSMCSNGIKPTDTIRMFFTNERHENEYIPPIKNVRDFVFIDDASYSGSQLNTIIETVGNHYLKQTNDIINFHIILAVCKFDAMSYLNSLRFDSKKIYLHVGQYRPFDFYFSHKLSDPISIKTTEIAPYIQGCENYYKDSKKRWNEYFPPCPHPPYKNKNDLYKMSYYKNPNNLELKNYFTQNPTPLNKNLFENN